ncbi:hypothetical protein [Sulfitobacter dubius]|uniref:Uncharacterized protein n=1 Tax=Sulfitobacter dubius TaxID=218673 RepID=A0ABY3ZIH4_9RHOB|nr:hypothetical protein [Sulfitobacter dubius]UOA14480.1 hypothetical protein DSM109990_01286 [Sulfitobacter dubius]
MTETHFTPRKVIELTLANSPESTVTALPDTCAGTAAFNIMAVTAPLAAKTESGNV